MTRGDLPTPLAWREHRTEWRQRAACRGTDPNHWHPTSLTELADVIGWCRTICNRCPVQPQCLTEALNLPLREDQGIRAGLTPTQRRTLRHKHTA